MSNEIFRKVSLERLSSPEQLDQSFAVTSPRAWYALLAVGCILCVTLLWGVFGSLPVKTDGHGMIMKSYGVYNITHTEGGQVSDIKVSVGDNVKRGDVVARIEQPELVVQINNLTEPLEQLKGLEISDAGSIKQIENPSPELAELYDLLWKIKEARAVLADEAEARYKLDLARVQEKYRQDYYDKMRQLYEKGAISAQDLTQASEDLEVARLEAEEAAAQLSGKLGQAQLNIQLLEEKYVATKAMKVAELEQTLTRLQDELSKKMEIVSRFDGRVLEVQAKKGDIVQPGTSLVSLERTGNTVKLEVVLYVKAEEGKNIRPGMEAQISPSTVKKEEYGFMLGRVVSLSEYPATTRGMMMTLGSQELVSSLSGGSALLEVRLDVVTDDSTVSGYKWSSSQGPPMIINSGTLCTGTVTISEARPISMVIPIVKKTLSVN